MFILSQKKDQIIAFENGIITSQFGVMFASSDRENKYELGRYVSDGRAREILLDIMEWKKNNNSIYKMPEE